MKFSKTKRLTASVLAVTSALCSFNIVMAADATTYDITSGSVSITSDGTYIIKGNNTPTSNVISIADGVSATITLDNVNISTSASAAIEIAEDSAGDISLLLKGDNTLTTTKKNSACIQKDGSYGSLTIDVADGETNATLTAQGGTSGAGIGGSYTSHTANITINGGTIKSTGGSDAAGIGSGKWARSTASDNIEISGGNVTATGGSDAAGIGGGSRGTVTNVTISGGTVTATGTDGGAGIGAGASSSNGTSGIVIENASVKVTGGAEAYDIGTEDEKVYPVNSKGTTLYKATVPDAVSGYTITVDDAAYIQSTDAHSADDNNQYIYIPENTSSVEVSKGTASVVYHATLNPEANEIVLGANRLTDYITSFSVNGTYTYTGNAIIPDVEIITNGTELTEGVDYNIVAYNNINAGSATVYIAGIGSYSGNTSEKTFTILPKTMTDSNMLISAPETELGNGATPPSSLTVMDYDNYKTLVEGVDYTVEYSNNTTPGRATITVTGIGNYTGTATGSYTLIGDNDINNCTITIADADYTGMPVTNNVTITDGSKKLVENTDYTLVYAANTNPGTAIVTISGIGSYSGDLTRTFLIKANPVEISNAAQLAAFAQQVNNGAVYLSGKLTADIDFSGNTEMIGTADKRYNGTFDGNGYTVTVNYSNAETLPTALFRFISGATIKNLKTSGSITTSSTYGAGIVGANETYPASISNCSSDVVINSRVTGNGYHGGIIGKSDVETVISNCAFTGEIKGATTTNCAGIAGLLNASGAKISCCYVTAAFNLSYSDNSSSTIAGGSIKAANISNCYYLNALNNNQGSQKTSEQFASGAVCYLLNNSVSYGTLTWYQNLESGTADALPVLDSTHNIVYSRGGLYNNTGEFSCDVDGNGKTEYLDAARVLRHLIGIEALTDAQINIANVNGGDLDITDAVAIMDIARDY